MPSWVSTVTGLALTVGIPVGHWTWGVLAGSLGIPADFVMPPPPLLFMVPAVAAARLDMCRYRGRFSSC